MDQRNRTRPSEHLAAAAAATRLAAGERGARP
jgi:hypothetical protein